MKCEICNTEFTYFKIFKSFWNSYNDLECEICKANYEHKSINRFMGGIIIGGSFLINNLLRDYDYILEFKHSMFLSIILPFVFSLFIPYFMKFKKK